MSTACTVITAYKVAK